MSEAVAAKDTAHKILGESKMIQATNGILAIENGDGDRQSAASMIALLVSFVIPNMEHYLLVIL